MKKFIALMLVIAMAASLAACGNKAADKTPLEGTMEENTMKVMEIAPVEFMGGIIPVDLTDTSEDGKWAVSYFTGLSDAAKITDVAVYESMMGSQAYSLVLCRVKNAADAPAVAQQMRDGIDQRKWVCVNADDLMVSACGDVVMLVMISSDYAETGTAASLTDAFKKVCGTELTTQIR
jgi:hypothetical protein